MPLFNQVFAQSNPGAVFLGNITHRHLFGELEAWMLEITINRSRPRHSLRSVFGDGAGEMGRPSLFQLERESHRSQAWLLFTGTITVNPAPDTGHLFPSRGRCGQGLAVNRTDRGIVRIFLSTVGAGFHDEYFCPAVLLILPLD